MIKDVDRLLAFVYARIRTEVPNFAVVGMSGGADSTLTAILCANALGPEMVVGVHMPYDENDSKTVNVNSQNVADKLGIVSLLVPIGFAANSLISAINLKLEKVNKGNMRSRMRMATLYAISHHFGGRVVGTGNLSEDFIGYDTKGGDALADIFPIGELVKSEIYQLLEYFCDNEIIEEKNINRVPSAGLWDGQTDEEELGYSYDEMEPAVKKFFYMEPDEIREWGHQPEGVEKFVLDRHYANRHKHKAPPVITGLRRYCGD